MTRDEGRERAYNSVCPLFPCQPELPHSAGQHRCAQMAKFSRKLRELASQARVAHLSKLRPATMPPQMPTTYSPSFHPTPPNPAFFRPLSTSQDTSSNPYTSNLVSCIGLGASSFSTFFPSPTAKSEWIKTIHHALKSHINVIDTAPWYGHGTSEETLGAALATVPRSVYYIHTKVGRYEADVKNMFDFSAEKTKESVLLSIKRMGCGHIDLIQIHDPEFALDLSQILAETLPALAKLRSEGLVTAIGITGYPLSVQREIIERSDVKIDVSLTYGHVRCSARTQNSRPSLLASLNPSLTAATRRCVSTTIASSPAAHPRSTHTAKVLALKHSVHNPPLLTHTLL